MTFLQFSKSFPLQGGIFTFACECTSSYCCCCCCACNTLSALQSRDATAKTINDRALKFFFNIARCMGHVCIGFAKPNSGPLGHHGPPKSKMGPLSSFASFCIPEVNLNRRAPKLGRNVHLYRLFEISNVFFRTPGRARSGPLLAKTR